MKLGLKLLFAPVATAAIVLAAGQVDTYLVTRANDEARTAMARHLADLKTVADRQRQIGEIHIDVYRTMTLIASMDEAKIKAFRQSMVNQLDGVKRVLDATLGSEEADLELKRRLAAGIQLLDKYKQQADAAVDLASVDPNTGIASMQSADATFAALVKSAAAVGERKQALVADAAASAEAQATRLHWLLAALALACAGGAIGLSWLMQRRLIADLQLAAQAASDVAAGNLRDTPPTDRSDEIGDLMRAIGSMVGQLRTTLQSVQQASQSIGNASSEIATGNLDLSQRTEQTASSLQQTASSMEELTATVRQSADSAATASQLATSAGHVARRGGEAVAQVVTTMDEINTSSKKIADIIGVIDGIAFQTNILALNAAVEAARAGEQGRGFAVVAGEVRSLAQRSAEAAREIKALIGNSVSKVEAGARQVQEAGATMNEIVASVQRVTDVIGEISAATKEQSSGLGLVNGTVSELDRMTQRNAALVEQSAAAAESLRAEARRLASMVATFDLGPHRDLAVAPPPPPGPRTPVSSSPSSAPTRPDMASVPAKAPVPKSPAEPLASRPVGIAARVAASTSESGWESF